MPGLLIKNVPPELHSKLKATARKHRRSMTQEALVILDRALAPKVIHFPEPFEARKPLTQKMVSDAIREGRE